MEIAFALASFGVLMVAWTVIGCRMAPLHLVAVDLDQERDAA